MKSQYPYHEIEVFYITIHLEWYRIFMHTARLGNLTKAAQELHITQPSVSYAIKQMEGELGVKLFQRLSKGVELTEEGRALFAYVEQSFALLDAAEQHVTDLKQLTAGEVRIGASDSLIKHLLLPKLHAYHQENPGIRIRLSHGSTPAITQRLLDGQIDCAVLHLPVDDTRLDVHPLRTYEHGYVVGQAYGHVANRTISAQELAKLPHLLLSPGSSTRVFVEQWFAAHGLRISPDIELGSIDLLIEFAKLGFGVAFIARSFVAEEVRRGDLIELRVQEPIPQRSIGLAVRRGMSLSLAAERFAELLSDGLGAEPG
jgi:LysR family transcriptional regulator, low CO2-responsive transcriptional regulator